MVEISRSPTLRPLQTPIFNLSPISTGLSIQEEEEPRWASLRASTEIPPGPTAMQTYFFFNSPFSNWESMLLRKQLTFYQPRAWW